MLRVYRKGATIDEKLRITEPDRMLGIDTRQVVIKQSVKSLGVVAQLLVLFQQNL